MLFSSTLFLFYFLPSLLLLYFLAPTIKIKNHVLLLFSFVFFAWGGVSFTLILILSISFNFFIGKLVEKHETKFYLILGIAGNVLALVVFKYADFLISNINVVFSAFHIKHVSSPGLILPIGISFYTFHSISYIIDVYTKKSPAQRNIFNMALYIVLFTQLIAGPIIRYNVFSPQLFGRNINFEKFANGVERFIVGLGKKVLIANTIGRIADAAFSQNISEMDAILSWTGILCYTFQIYFDFSGYSDMAIGLSKIFGFEFPENFNKPYTSISIRDFWRRWHISLSSFFRDYLYIPLGGNQKGKRRTYINLIIVFFLTGLWHGANYTFIAWGLIHGGFLLLERGGLERTLQKIPVFLQRLYAFLIVVLAWVPFRSDNISYSSHFLEESVLFLGTFQS
jgi:alginate O-acetyltransferase complex protein AlgI